MIAHEPAELSAAEREQLLLLARGPSSPYERGASVDAVFAQRAVQTPDAVAICDDAGSLSYRQVDAEANRLAHHLQSIGVRGGMTVGVACERSRDIPIAFLAILKCGCTYVPIDAMYPDERVAFIVNDAAINVIIGRGFSAVARFGSVRLVDLDAVAAAIRAQSAAAPTRFAASDATAYIMYTSGSTGRPKGVAVPHRAIVRLVRGADYVTLGPGETILQFAPAAFDASTFEIWGALLNGGRLAFPPRGLLSIDDLGAAVERYAVTTLWLTTSIFIQLVDAARPDFGRLHQLLTGGSAGSPRHLMRFLELYPRCTLINGYGPTENTTFSTAYALTSPQAIGTNPPIGRPIANSTAYVVDEELRLVPLGTAGELAVGGDGVAIGYVNLPAETARRFVADPFSPDPTARLYRTGDRVRMRTDGVIEFLGRTDDQVKINGFRIELGEIEAALRAHRGLRDAAVVVVGSDAEKLLCAYVVLASAAALDEAELRSYLRRKLPAFMLPARIAFVPELPLHPSGKIDRLALAARAVPSAPGPASLTLAHGKLRRPALGRAVAQIWSEVLANGSTPDPDVNFFDAGGDSVRLLRLRSLLNERLGVEVSVLDLFEHTTIVRMTELIAALNRA